MEKFIKIHFLLLILFLLPPLQQIQVHEPEPLYTGTSLPSQNKKTLRKTISFLIKKIIAPFSLGTAAAILTAYLTSQNDETDYETPQQKETEIIDNLFENIELPPASKKFSCPICFSKENLGLMFILTCCTTTNHGICATCFVDDLTALKSKDYAFICPYCRKIQTGFLESYIDEEKRSSILQFIKEKTGEDNPTIRNLFKDKGKKLSFCVNKMKIDIDTSLSHIPLEDLKYILILFTQTQDDITDLEKAIPQRNKKHKALIAFISTLQKGLNAIIFPYMSHYTRNIPIIPPLTTEKDKQIANLSFLNSRLHDFNEESLGDILSTVTILDKITMVYPKLENQPRANLKHIKDMYEVLLSKETTIKDVLGKTEPTILDTILLNRIYTFKFKLMYFAKEGGTELFENTELYQFLTEYEKNEVENVPDYPVREREGQDNNEYEQSALRVKFEKEGTIKTDVFEKGIMTIPSMQEYQPDTLRKIFNRAKPTIDILYECLMRRHNRR